METPFHKFNHIAISVLNYNISDKSTDTANDPTILRILQVAYIEVTVVCNHKIVRGICYGSVHALIPMTIH